MEVLSNGVRVSDPHKNYKELSEFLHTVGEFLVTEGRPEVEFVFEKEPYPSFVIPTNVSYEEFRKAVVNLGGKVFFKAVGNECVAIPGLSIRKIKHIFDQDEKEAIADKLTETIEQKAMTERQKKEVMAEYKNKLDMLDSDIMEQSQVYRNGYEVNEQDVIVQMDFENNVKVYVDPGSHEVLDSEKMNPADYQMRIDYFFQDADLQDIKKDKIKTVKASLEDRNKKKDSDAKDFTEEQE